MPSEEDGGGSRRSRERREGAGSGMEGESHGITILKFLNDHSNEMAETTNAKEALGNVVDNLIGRRNWRLKRNIKQMWNGFKDRGREPWCRDFEIH